MRFETGRLSVPDVKSGQVIGEILKKGLGIARTSIHKWQFLFFHFHAHLKFYRHDTSLLY